MSKRFAYVLVSSLAMVCLSSTIAQTNEGKSKGTAVNPYTLCAKSPDNSMCQPYHVNPVALDDRLGEEVLACVLKTGQTEELKGSCKYSISTDQFVVYIEEEQELESLDGKKPTRIISVSTNNILKLLYEEETIENRPALVDIITPVHITRRVLRRPKNLALMTVVFPMVFNNVQPGSSATGSANTTQQQPIPITATLVVKQEDGGTVRAQLENATKLTSEAPPTGN